MEELLLLVIECTWD